MDCRKSHLPSLPFSHQGLWTRTFSIYAFIFSFKGMGLGEEGTWSVGSSVSILHLQGAWGVGVGVSVGRTGRWQEPRSRLPLGGGHQYTSPPPAVLSPCLTTDSYCPSLWGLSALGEGTAQRLCPALGPHPRNAKTLPPPQRHPAWRLWRPSGAALSAVVLSLCPFSPYP